LAHVARRGDQALPADDAEARIRALEAQLASRDQEIGTMRAELDAARMQANSGAPAAAGTGGGSAGSLAEAQRQIATLEARLDAEVQRRKSVEAEMTRLLEETSAGPYERTQGAAEKHLRQELDQARGEIVELRTTLATERRQRSELERRFAALQSRAEESGRASGGGEELEALKERQRRVLASIRQDLEASREREAELRASLERTQGTDGAVLSGEVSGLRAENAALQRRLDEEHKRNQALAQKLKLAGRVTDLIFKMQSSGAVQAVPALPAQ
jgi:chromosome segregation ATPase